MSTTEIQANSAALSNAAEFVKGAIDLHADPSARGATLQAIRHAQEELGRATGGAVAAFRRSGASWDDVGRALGMSRQAAWERFR